MTIITPTHGNGSAGIDDSIPRQWLALLGANHPECSRLFTWLESGCNGNSFIRQLIEGVRSGSDEKRLRALGMLKVCFGLPVPQVTVASPEVTFTIVKSAYPVGKIFGLGEKAEIKKRSSAGISLGTAVRRKIPLANLVDEIKNADVHTVLMKGVYSGTDEAQIGSRKECAKNPDLVQWGKRAFPYPDSTCLFIIDYDPQPGTKPLTRDDLIKQLHEAVPGTKGVAYVWSASVSSGVRREGETGPPRIAGQRIYMPVRYNGKRDAEWLYAYMDLKLVNAGHGHARVDRAGRRHIRTLIDKALKTSSQLDYIGAPQIQDSGLVFQRPEPHFVPGKVLDVGVLPAINDTQLSDYRERVKDLKEQVADIANAARKAFKATHQDGSQTADPALGKYLDRAVREGILTSNFTLHFVEHGQVTVGEVLSNMGKYNEAELYDPIEPDYRHWSAVGIFYANDGVSPQVFSWAHSGALFKLRYDLDDAKRRIGELSDTERHAMWAEIGALTHLADEVEEDRFLIMLTEKFNIGGDKKARRQKLKAARNTRDHASLDESPSVTQIVDERVRALWNGKDIATSLNAIRTAMQTGPWGDKLFDYGGSPTYMFDSDEPDVELLTDDGLSVLCAKHRKFTPLNECGIELLLQRNVILVGMLPDRSIGRIETPYKLIKHLLSLQFTKNIRTLSGIVRHPIIVPNTGRLLNSDGYDADTRLFFDLGDFPTVDIPEAPSLVDARAAMQRVDTIMFSETEFESTLDHSGAWHLLLTAMLRKLIGEAPMFAITAKVPGVGKTMLGKIVHIVSTGQQLNALTLSNDNEEVRKVLLPELQRSPDMICFDNMAEDTTLDSPALALLITNPTYGDRKLGASEIVRVQSNTTVAVTGNNLKFSQDFQRRCLEIRLTSQLMEPENKKYKIKRREAHVLAHRLQILRDLLIILKAYHRAGHPSPDNSIGFQDWESKVRGPLEWLGLPDITQALKRGKADNEVRLARQGLLAGLRLQYSDKEFTSAELYDDVLDRPTLSAQNPETKALMSSFNYLNDDRYASPKLTGQILNKCTGTKVDIDGVIMELRKRPDKHQKINMWRVVPVDTPR